MFYRGKELKNECCLDDSGFQRIYKDEEGIEQPLTICILCHIGKITENQMKEAVVLQTQGKLPTSYIEYLITMEQ